jgi:hypothetical protein
MTKLSNQSVRVLATYVEPFVLFRGRPPKSLWELAEFLNDECSHENVMHGLVDSRREADQLFSRIIRSYSRRKLMRKKTKKTKPAQNLGEN